MFLDLVLNQKSGKETRVRTHRSENLRRGSGKHCEGSQESRRRKAPASMTADYSREQSLTKAMRHSRFQLRKLILVHNLSRQYVHTRNKTGMVVIVRRLDSGGGTHSRRAGFRSGRKQCGVRYAEHQQQEDWNLQCGVEHGVMVRQPGFRQDRHTYHLYSSVPDLMQIRQN